MDRKYKLIGWHIVLTLLAWSFWSFGLFTFSGSDFGFNFFGGPVINFLILTSLIVLGFALFRNKVWLLSVSGIVGLFYFLFTGFTPLSALGISIFLLLSIYARSNILSESRFMIKINSRKILRSGLYPVILGFFVLISFAAYQSPAIQGVEAVGELPPRAKRLVDVMVKSIIGSRISVPDEGAKENIINEISSQVFSDINILIKPYLGFAPPVLAFGLFLILWGLSWAFMWLGVFMGMAIFWTLKKTNLVEIREIDIKAETLVV